MHTLSASALVLVRGSGAWAIVVAAGLTPMMAACSSSDDPPPANQGDGGAGDGGREGGANQGGACSKDKERLAEDDAAVCCEGLFKHCPSISMAGEPKPCVCSTLECGTKEKQPPPNVNCCLGIASRCELVLGTNENQCVCGDP